MPLLWSLDQEGLVHGLSHREPLSLPGETGWGLVVTIDKEELKLILQFLMSLLFKKVSGEGDT